MSEAEYRIKKALEVAMYGGIDGSHHKMWVIDQMIRHLTGCPVVLKAAVNIMGDTCHFKTLGEGAEYLNWVAAYESGEDGPNTYEWETGIAP